MRKLPFLRRPPIIAPLSEADCDILQQLHAEAFFHSWDSEAFRRFLADEQVIGFGARLRQPGGRSSGLSGFILARLIRAESGGEAEILTFAIAAKARRRGLGRALLEHLLRHLYQERAEALFLEVDEHNQPALNLYRGLHFAEIGRRKAYYQPAPAAEGAPAPARADAVLLEYRFKNAAKSL